MPAGLTNTAALADSMQLHFSKDMLDRMLPLLKYADFAMKTNLPAKSGARSMRLFRFTEPTAQYVVKVPTATKSDEGKWPLAALDPTNYRQLTLEYVDALLDQYVQTISITDVADATNLFNLVEQANLQNAEDAALHCDTLTLYELIPNTGSGAGTGNVDYTKKPKIFAGAAIDYATTNTPVAADKVVTATDILDAATILKVNRAPTINGSYVMLAPPQVTRDIMQGISSNTVWVDVSKYSAPTQLFNGEVGKLYGVRVVEHTNVYRSGATEPTTHATVLTAKNDTGAVFHSHVFGRNAYGQPNLSTLGSPYSPSVSIVQGADKADPANLIKALCSWKTFWCAKVLQPKWIVHLYSQSAAPAA